MTNLAIATPTFRRPKGLRSLLTEIQRIPLEVRVIVADNDSERGEGVMLVKELVTAGYPHDLRAFVVPERGIAQVRNALVARAIADPDLRLLAMIDDDETPKAGWLEALLETQAQTRADVVGGPVVRRYEKPVPRHLELANDYGPGSRSTGPVAILDATSNILFNAEVFREVEGPWFDPFFALTGGEDKDFMVALKLRSKTFAWTNKAIVEETYPASRCSSRWAIARAYSTGNSDMLINLRRRPPGFNAASESAKIIGAASVALVNVSVLGFDPNRRFYGLRLAARVAGKLSALAGRRHNEYQVVHGG